MKIAVFEFSLFGINTYVLSDEATKDCAIVDPGMMTQDEKDALVNYISREGLTVTQIINTHLHVDHAIGNKFAADKYLVPVKAHKSDEFLGKSLPSQATMFGLSPEVANVSISEYLEDGDKIHIGHSVLEVIHVPGHSPGSIALYCPKDKFLIAGDILFAGSIGRTDLPGGNHEQLLTGIKNKLFTLPEETVVYPGHGPSTTIGREKRSNPFF